MSFDAGGVERRPKRYPKVAATASTIAIGSGNSQYVNALSNMVRLTVSFVSGARGVAVPAERRTSACETAHAENPRGRVAPETP